MQERILVVSVLLLSGCAFIDRGGEENNYIGWYCADNPGAGGRVCEKRLMRNGVPVSDEIYGRVSYPGDSSGGPNQERWTETLPALDSRPSSFSENKQAIRGEKTETLAKPVPVFDHWQQVEDALNPASTQDNKNTKPPTQAHEKQVGAVSGKGNWVSSAAEGLGYTVQLGAFQRENSCTELMNKLSRDDVRTEVHHVLSQGKPFCIVTMGRYGSKTEAETVAADLTAVNKGMATWVRSWASIKGAAVSP